jgi:hypothetical protein
VFYDLDFRYRRALFPEALSLATVDRAIADAIEDAGLAGFDPETDPAVGLLRAHKSSLCGESPADVSLLRSSCEKRITVIERNPAIIQIVQSGAAGSGRGALDFRREAKMTLLEIGRRLAPHDRAPIIKVRSRPGTPEELSLESDLVTIEIYGHRWNCDHAIAYWRTSNSRRRHTLPITALRDISGVIAQINQKLALSPASRSRTAA